MCDVQCRVCGGGWVGGWVGGGGGLVGGQGCGLPVTNAQVFSRALDVCARATAGSLTHQRQARELVQGRVRRAQGPRARRMDRTGPRGERGQGRGQGPAQGQRARGQGPPRNPQQRTPPRTRRGRTPHRMPQQGRRQERQQHEVQQLGWQQGRHDGTTRTGSIKGYHTTPNTAATTTAKSQQQLMVPYGPAPAAGLLADAGAAAGAAAPVAPILMEIFLVAPGMVEGEGRYTSASSRADADADLRSGVRCPPLSLYPAVGWVGADRTGGTTRHNGTAQGKRRDKGSLAARPGHRASRPLKTKTVHPRRRRR